MSRINSNDHFDENLVADLVNDAVVTDADAAQRVLLPHRHMTQR